MSETSLWFLRATVTSGIKSFAVGELCGARKARFIATLPAGIVNKVLQRSALLLSADR
jgi:hypothetical protein